jgi:peptidoglycan/xylan/chitin deacetylase (PgdA/CDA1 family)
VVARRDGRDARPDALDDARARVAQHGRQRHRVPLVADDEVGVADARGGHADQHLAGPRLLELHRLDGERRSLGLRDGGLYPHARQAIGMARRLALTFDNLGAAAERARGDRPAEPHPSVALLPALLDLLRELDLTATFCVEAVNTEEHPGAVRAIAAAGHAIALHGWAHERWDGEVESMARARDAFAALGIRPTGYRPPGGELPPGGLRALAAAGLRWCSPEGDRVHTDADTGIAVIPFRWPLVDATYLHVPFGDLRERLGLPRAPLSAAETERRLRDELASDREPVLILHPFLAADPDVRAMHERLLRHIAEERDAGALAPYEPP